MIGSGGFRKRKIIIRPSGPIGQHEPDHFYVFRDADAAAVPGARYDFPDSLRKGAYPFEGEAGYDQNPTTEDLWLVAPTTLESNYDTGRKLTLQFRANNAWKNLTFPQYYPLSVVELWVEVPTQYAFPDIVSGSPSQPGTGAPSWHLNEATPGTEVCIFKGWIRQRRAISDNTVEYECRDALFRADDVLVVRDIEAGIEIPKLVFNVTRDDPEWFYAVKRVDMQGITEPPNPAAPFILPRIIGTGETLASEPYELQSTDWRMTLGEILDYLQTYYATRLALIGVGPTAGTLFDPADLANLTYKPGPVVLENIGFAEAVRQVLRWAPEVRLIVDHQTQQWRIVPVGISLDTVKEGVSSIEVVGNRTRLTFPTVFERDQFAVGDRVRLYHVVINIGAITYGPEINEEAWVDEHEGANILYLDRALVGRDDGLLPIYYPGSSLHKVQIDTMATVGLDADVEPGWVELQEDLDGAYSAALIYSIQQETETYTVPYASGLSGGGATQELRKGWDVTTDVGGGRTFEDVWRQDLHEDRRGDVGAGDGIPIYKYDALGAGGQIQLWYAAEDSQHGEEQVNNEWNFTSLWVRSLHREDPGNPGTWIPTDITNERRSYTIKQSVTVADIGDGRGGVLLTLEATSAEWDPTPPDELRTEETHPGDADVFVISTDYALSTTKGNNKLWEVGRKWYSESVELVDYGTPEPHQVSCRVTKINVHDGSRWSDRGSYALGPNQGVPGSNIGPASAWETLASGGLGAIHVWRRASYTQKPVVDQSARACEWRGWAAPKKVEYTYEKTTSSIRTARFPASGFDGLVNVRYGLERVLVFATDSWVIDAQTPDYEALVQRLWNVYSQRAHSLANVIQPGILANAVWLDLAIRCQIGTKSQPAGAASGLTGFWGALTSVSIDFAADTVSFDFDSSVAIDSIDLRLWEEVTVQPAARVDKTADQVRAVNQLASCFTEMPASNTAPGTCASQIKDGPRNAGVKGNMPMPKQVVTAIGDLSAGVPATAAPGSSAGSGGRYASHGPEGRVTGFRDSIGRSFIIEEGGSIVPAGASDIRTLVPDTAHVRQPKGIPQQNQDYIETLSAAFLGVTTGVVKAPRLLRTAAGSTTLTIVLDTSAMEVDEYQFGRVDILDFSVPRPSYVIASNTASTITLTVPMSENPPGANVTVFVWPKPKPYTSPLEEALPTNDKPGSNTVPVQDRNGNWVIINPAPGQRFLYPAREDPVGSGLFVIDVGSVGTPREFQLGWDGFDNTIAPNGAAIYHGGKNATYDFRDSGPNNPTTLLVSTPETTDPPEQAASKGYVDDLVSDVVGALPLEYMERQQTAAGAWRAGIGSDYDEYLIVPDGYEAVVIRASGILNIRTGAQSVAVIVTESNDPVPPSGGIVDRLIETVDTGSGNRTVFLTGAGSVGAPLGGPYPPGRWIAVGWENDGPSTLRNEEHHVWVDIVLRPL